MVRISAAETVEDALDAFSRRACALDLKAVYGRVPAGRGSRIFSRGRRSGGACKRLNLFLRWMVRHDRVDLGVWTRVRPAQLIVPLDTHVIRVGRCLRLTRYRARLADGGGHHPVAAGARSRRSGAVTTFRSATSA